jgi:hypothetical protein
MLSVEIGDESNVAYCLEGLAAIAASEDKLERATIFYLQTMIFQESRRADPNR